jgi:hypothetical protein
MRAIVFTTGTPDTIKLIESFTCLGHQTEVIRYDIGTEGIGMEGKVATYRPDLIVYIGAIKGQHDKYVPSLEELCRLNHVAPMVHICSDSANPPWWPDLEAYNNAGAFRLQVGIDGCKDSPIARFGMVALTPVDPAYFPTETTWDTRIYPCGFAGGIGIRESILGPIRAQGLLTHFGSGGHPHRYEELCQFYTLCQTVINDARTGTGTRRHVKGRFVEAGLGGALLIEPHDSPAQDWFTPDVDYLVWHDPGEAIGHVRNCYVLRDKYAEMAKRFHAQMLEQHSAPPLWARVFKEMRL